MWKRFILPVCILIFISLLYYVYRIFVYDYFTTPKLILKGQETEMISLNANYTEHGYVAKIGQKNVNKDVIVSNNINNEKVGTYEVKYSVKNKAGNKKATLVRKVIVVDQEKPIIKLVGDNVTIYKGKNYEEPGYSAIDNYDGDITSKVVVSNQVDINKIGTYYINYTVKDSSGNETATNRKIDVINYPQTTNTSGGAGIPILMYHFFYDSSLGEKGADNSNWMDISLFDEEMRYLKDNNYYFPSWDELEKYIDGKLTLSSKSIFVTIDDGQQSFFNLAYPVLKKYGVKATSFVVTSWTNVNSYAIDRSLIDFESHSNNMHQGFCKGGHGGIFQCINYNDGYNDLMTSINILGSSKVFSYPYGDYNDHTIRLLKDTGFKMAVTTNYGKVKVGMNKLLLPRVRINGDCKINNFINAIK